MSDAPRESALVLVVEDDPAIANLVRTALESHGAQVAVAGTAQEAISCAAELSPRVILLDLGLPDADKIGALDAGADDYLVKPFSVGELLARVRVALRRASHEPGPPESPTFENGGLTIDYAAGIARVNGEELRLTGMEYRLLVLLSRNADKVLTHQYLLEHAWGEGQVGDLASLRVLMASLRKKLARAGADGLIQTHVGVGYRLLRSS